MPIPLVFTRLDARREEIEGAFVYCADCQDVHRVTNPDRAPIYALDGAATAADDFQSFFARHIEHNLRILWRSSDAEWHSHARYDPMRRVCWEVSDGKDWFVVSFGREDLESPRRYAIAPGRLIVDRESIDIDGELLHEVIDDALYPSAAPPSKLETFIERCRAAVASLAWEAFELVDEDRDDPNIQQACLPESVVKQLRHDAREIFAGPEGERVAELVQRDLRFEIPVIHLARRYTLQSP